MKLGRNIAISLICIMLGIMLSLQFKSINYNKILVSNQSQRVEDVMQKLIAQQKKNMDLEKRLQELKEDNEALEGTRADDNKNREYYNEQLNRARIFAGLVPVKGQGVIVTLTDNGDLLVHERDIMDVVNELRAAGAQAISINEERVVAMSEIREAGNYIMVNGTQLESPYIIKAISTPEKLERSLLLIDGILQDFEDWGIDASVKKSEEMIIPAVRDDGSVIKTDLLSPIEK